MSDTHTHLFLTVLPRKPGIPGSPIKPVRPAWPGRPYNLIMSFQNFCDTQNIQLTSVPLKPGGPRGQGTSQTGCGPDANSKSGSKGATAYF
jgi:hypothetical protein